MTPARLLPTGTVSRVSSTPSAPDFYEVLGVSRTASSEEVRQAYRVVSKRTHPDAGGNSGLFRLVSEAHAVLSDPGRRVEYDRALTASEKVADDLSRREAEVAMREAALRLAQSVPVGSAQQDVPVAVGPVPPVVPVAVPPVVLRPYSSEWFGSHWRGWVASTLVVALGPVAWVLFGSLDVWASLGVSSRYPVVDDAVEWFSTPVFRWGWLMLMAAAVGVGSFRLRVYLLVRSWSPVVQRSAGCGWLVAGAALPVLPSVWGFLLLGVAAALPVCVGAAWRRVRPHR